MNDTIWTVAATSPVMHRTSLDGYHPSGTSSTSCTREDAIERLAIGAVFIDRDSIPLAEFIDCVISGPMVNPAADAPGIDRCPQPSPMLSGSLEGQFKSLVAIHSEAISAQPNEPGPLDSLSIPEFAAWWESRGATVYIKLENGKLG